MSVLYYRSVRKAVGRNSDRPWCGRPRSRHRLLATAIAPGSGLSPFRPIELKTYDWRLTRTGPPETARKDIALVEIDEFSLRNLEPYAGRWPWPRVIHSMLIDYLGRRPGEVIVLRR